MFQLSKSTLEFLNPLIYVLYSLPDKNNLTLLVIQTFLFKTGQSIKEIFVGENPITQQGLF